MLQPPNMTSHELDPATRECRVSFLKAIEKFHPSVLCDLEMIFEKRLSGSDLDRAREQLGQASSNVSVDDRDCTRHYRALGT